jgi:hypothetical protein
MRTPSIFTEATECAPLPSFTKPLYPPMDTARNRHLDPDVETTSARVDRLAKLAVEGDAAAQLQYGIHHDLGDGVPLDAAKAAYWYRRSARQGVVAAQYRLACSHWFGRGVPNDFIRACALYEKATIQGYDGRKSVVLDDVSPDNTWVPTLWYGPAAEERFNHAHYRLGQCYTEGSGIDQDDERAAHHFDVAASLRTVFSPDGHGEAQSALALCYLEGRGVERDEESAVYWWRRAASQRVPDACNNLGAAIQLGIAGPRDNQKGFELFLEAAHCRHASGQFNVAECYAAGRGVEEDFGEAAKWYAKSATQGYIPAMRNLAICYEHGIGVEKSAVVAMELRARIAQQSETEVENSFSSTSEQQMFRRMAAYFAK